MARRTENHQQPRRRLYPSMVPRLHPVHREERQGMRCGSGRSGVASGNRQWPPYHETYGQERGHRSRYGASCHGFPQARATEVCRERIRGRRCRPRRQPRSTCLGRRTTSGGRDRPLSRPSKRERGCVKIHLNIFFRHGLRGLHGFFLSPFREIRVIRA